MTDREVDIFAPEIRQRVACADIQIDLRVLREKLADPRQQPAGRERRHDADPKLPRVSALGQFANRVAQIREHRTNASGEALAFVGQPDAASRALDQANAEVLLQRLDLMTDGSV